MHWIQPTFQHQVSIFSVKNTDGKYFRLCGLGAIITCRKPCLPIHVVNKHTFSIKCTVNTLREALVSEEVLFFFFFPKELAIKSREEKVDPHQSTIKL